VITIVKLGPEKGRTDIGKCCFLNMTMKLWNQLPAESLATFHCKSHISGKRVKKVITSEVKRRGFEGWWCNVPKCREVKNGE